jgi:UDP-sulfoquinovose synthase
VNDLANKVVAAGGRAGLEVSIAHLKNPRIELEEHYYNAIHSKLGDLGLVPNLLTDAVVDDLLQAVRGHAGQADPAFANPKISWARSEPA